jgi:hypothetical protein
MVTETQIALKPQPKQSLLKPQLQGGKNKAGLQPRFHEIVQA